MAKSLSAPTDVETIEWKTLQDILKEYYAPSASPLTCQHEFYHRDQKMSETINDFVANLREIAAECLFINLEEMMRDRLVLVMI